MSVTLRLKEDLMVTGLGRYFSAQDKTETDVVLATADGKELARAQCRAENESDMLGFKYGSCENAVLLEAGKEYVLSCTDKNWEHYTGMSAETTNEVMLVDGIPLFNMVSERNQDKRR